MRDAYLGYRPFAALEPAFLRLLSYQLHPGGRLVAFAVLGYNTGGRQGGAGIQLSGTPPNMRTLRRTEQSDGFTDPQNLRLLLRVFLPISQRL